MPPTPMKEQLHALRNAQKSGDRTAQAQAHASLGKRYLTRNNYREAGRHYQQAVELYRSLDKEEHLARALNHLGVCRMMVEEKKAAIDLFQQALQLEKGAPHPRLRAAILGNLGLVHTSLNDYAKAESAHRKVLALAEKIHDPRLELQAHINLSDLTFQSGQYPEASALAREALDRARELGETAPQIALLDLLGRLSSRQGDVRRAVELHDQAAQKAMALGDLQRQAIALANKALALERLTEMDQAYQAMQKAQAIFQSVGSTYQEKTHKDLQRIKKGLEER